MRIGEKTKKINDILKLLFLKSTLKNTIRVINTLVKKISLTGKKRKPKKLTKILKI